ncbi:hypothetical protein N9N67_09125 [Bacteriovoracaceae bacterium]|nr:hypothetical protein [Bacteriovoracaceae bacterium]
MKLIILLLGFSQIAMSDDKKEKKRNTFYLQQVDYRYQASVSISLPGMIKLKLKPTYEARYIPKEKKPIIIDSKNLLR